MPRRRWGFLRVLRRRLDRRAVVGLVAATLVVAAFVIGTRSTDPGPKDPPVVGRDGPSGPSAPVRPAPLPTAPDPPGPTSVTSTTLASGPAARSAALEVERLGGDLPYPVDVLACVTNRAAGDAATLQVLVDAVPGEDSMSDALAVGASCFQAVRSAPVFAQNLQLEAGGVLTTAQLACAEQGYAGLSSEELELATAAAMNPAGAPEGASAPIDQILTSCEIPVPG